jgi:hypothetical protein
MTDKVRRLLEELGAAAAEPIATSDEKASEQTPEVSQEDLYAGEQAAEEVGAPIIESYTLEELNEAFALAGFNTRKYTVEYLAEQLGFRPVNEGFKEFAGSVGRGVKSGLKRLDNTSKDVNKEIEGSGTTGFGSMVGKGMVGVAKAAATPLAVGFGAVKGGIDHFKKNKGESKPKDTGNNVSESYTLSELNEAFALAGLDTSKYTTEYLAEQLGFREIILEGKIGDKLKRFVMPALFAANTAMSGGAMMNNINAVDQLKDNIRTQVYQDVDTDLQDNEDRILANANAIMSFSKPGSYQHELAKETIEAIRQGGPGKKTANIAPSSAVSPQYASFDTEDVISGKVKPLTTGRKYIQPRTAGTVDVFDNEDIDAEIASRIKSDETTKSLQRQAGNSALVGMASAGLAAGTAGKEIFDGKEPLVGSDVELPEVKLGKKETQNESYTLSELNEAFVRAGLDTRKYTARYIAEQLGFVPLSEMPARLKQGPRPENENPEEIITGETQADEEALKKKIGQGKTFPETYAPSLDRNRTGSGGPLPGGEYEYITPEQADKIRADIKKIGVDSNEYTFRNNVPKGEPKVYYGKPGVHTKTKNESFSSWSRKKVLNEYNPYLQVRRNIDGIDMAGLGGQNPQTQRTTIQSALGGLDLDTLSPTDKARVANLLRQGYASKEDLTVKKGGDSLNPTLSLAKRGFLGMFPSGFKPITVTTQMGNRGRNSIEDVRKSVVGELSSAPAYDRPKPESKPKPETKPETKPK